MGLLKHLLFWPVTGPSFLARFSLEKVQGVVRDELTDDTRVKEALLDLQLRLELGEIDDAEYEREEKRLMEELREVRRWREEFGLGTRGGGGSPGRSVRVSRPRRPVVHTHSSQHFRVLQVDVRGLHSVVQSVTQWRRPPDQGPLTSGFVRFVDSAPC